MRQLVDCIGLSARKKVLESGRTPRSALALTRTRTKSLRFATQAPLDFHRYHHRRLGYAQQRTCSRVGCER
jgi:hypothetical protein